MKKEVTRKFEVQTFGLNLVSTHHVQKSMTRN